MAAVTVPDLEELRDIIANDHFGGDMPDSIVQAWLCALPPGSQYPLPPNVKGLYGGDLRASMPIEIARGSYKYIAHETADKEKIKKYTRRMLAVLSIVDIDKASEKEPVIALLALWHKSLALVRRPDDAGVLMQTLIQYKELRPRSSLPDNKIPSLDRLQNRLLNDAREIESSAAIESLSMRL